MLACHEAWLVEVPSRVATVWAVEMISTAQLLGFKFSFRKSSMDVAWTSLGHINGNRFPLSGHPDMDQ